MSKPVVIPWLPSVGNTAAIAPVQNIGAGGGTLALTSGNSPYVFDRVIRKVSILAAPSNYTITGIGSPIDANGNPTQVLGPISEIVVGGNQSANIYKSVSSIFAATAGGCSAGFGASGITDYVFLDYNRTIGQTAVQTYFTVLRTGITYTGYISLNKPEFPNINNGNLTSGYPLPALPISVAFTGATTNQFDAILSPLALTWLSISGTQADSLLFTVLQQGI